MTQASLYGIDSNKRSNNTKLSFANILGKPIPISEQFDFINI